ncbi:hypothetical protein HUT18_19400 [Streptomyces sp. NA04227]|nr:hypothetical protein HUT18_19400 [Streptomyces sp. NA04227]
MAARRAIDFALGAERCHVGDEAMGFLTDEVKRLVDDYPRVPLSTIWADLASAQEDAFRLLEGGRARPSQLRDLNFIAAVLSFLMAKGSHDLGDPKAAMAQARTAAFCARHAEHSGLIAMVDGLKSLIAYWANRPEDALHFARQGSVAAADRRGTVGIWLQGLQARAAALLGDEETAAAARRRAVDLREQVQFDDLDAYGGLLTHSVMKQAYYMVEAEVLLQNGGSALCSQAEAAVAGFSDRTAPDWAFGDEAGSRCNLALTRLFSDDLDGAADAVRPVLDLPAGLRNNGIVVSVHRVRDVLAKGTMSSAALAVDLRQEIQTYSPPRPALS